MKAGSVRVLATNCQQEGLHLRATLCVTRDGERIEGSEIKQQKRVNNRHCNITIVTVLRKNNENYSVCISDTSYRKKETASWRQSIAFDPQQRQLYNKP